MYHNWEQELLKVLAKLESEQRERFKEYLYAVKIKQNVFSSNTTKIMQDYMYAYLRLSSIAGSKAKTESFRVNSSPINYMHSSFSLLFPS